MMTPPQDDAAVVAASTTVIDVDEDNREKKQKGKKEEDDDDDDNNAECPGGHDHNHGGGGGGGGGGSVHPMVPVPTAIRFVLLETARALVLNRAPSGDDGDGDGYDCREGTGTGTGTETEGAGGVESIRMLPSPPPPHYSEGEEASSFVPLVPFINAVGRILAEDVTMPEPGYPPYDASVMDGYAVISSEYKALMEAALAGKAAAAAAGEGEGAGAEDCKKKDDDDDNDDVPLAWTHRVVGRVYAGEEPFYPDGDGQAKGAATTTATEMVSNDNDASPLDVQRSSSPSEPHRSERSASAEAGDDDGIVKKDEGQEEAGADIVKEKDAEAEREGGDKVEDDDDDDDDDDDFVRRARKMLPAAMYVTTGAMVPPPYDCVVPIEEVALSSDAQNDDGNGNDKEKDKDKDDVLLKVNCSPKNIKPGKWIREVGCDIGPGTVVLNRGSTIGPSDVGLLAQVMGLSSSSLSYILKMTPVPRVGVLSTGNELLPSRRTPTSASAMHSQGKIPDANRPLLLSLLSTWKNAHPIDLGIVSDDSVQDLVKSLMSAFANDKCDVVLTTGGISVGEKDILERVLVKRMGAKVVFGRMHMKPGKPTTFMTLDVADARSGENAAEEEGGGGGEIGTNNDETKHPRRRCKRRRLVFCLPGNPVSAAVCANLLVRPCLDLLHAGAAAVAAAVEEGGGGGGNNDDDDERCDTTASTNPSPPSSPTNTPQTDPALLDRIVRSSIVHAEVRASLSHRIRLDPERPEYHRVSLAFEAPPSSHRSYRSGNEPPYRHGRFVATSTGVQQSSRLLSMHGAAGLMILPVATTAGKGDRFSSKTYAEEGEVYPVLLLGGGIGGGGGLATVKWKDSVHARMHESLEKKARRKANSSGPAVVRIVQVGRDDAAYASRESVHALKGRVGASLDAAAGPGRFRVSRTETVTLTTSSHDEGARELVRSVRSIPSSDKGGDVILVVCSSSVSFRTTLAVASELRSVMSKEADALALGARRGAAAASDGTAALFEVTVGYVRGQTEEEEEEEEPPSALVLLLPDAGLEGALEAVGGLIGHAIRVGAGEKGLHGGGWGGGDRSHDHEHHHNHHHHHSHEHHHHI